MVARTGLGFVMAGMLAGCRGEVAEPIAPTPTSAPLAASPDARPERDGIVEVVAGPESTCARTAQGRVACLGHAMAFSEQAPSLDTHVPRVVEVPPSQAISAGDGFACSVDGEGGKVRCWGSNVAGSLGRETPQSVDQRPLEVPGVQGVERLVSHGPRTCAASAERLWCWPSRDDPAPRSMPLQGRTLEQAIYDHTRSDRALEFSDEADRIVRPWRERLHEACPFMDDGLYDVDDGLYDAELDYGCRSSRGTVEVGPGVEVGMDHACRLEQGALRCQGADTTGQAPTPLPELGASVLDVAVGSEHTCVVIAEGELRCWGSSSRGQIGIEPVSARGPHHALSNIERIWLTDRNTCAQTKDGAFACTGRALDPCEAPSFTPLQGPGEIREMFELIGGEGCVVDASGEVWCGAAGHFRRTIAAEAFADPPAARSQHATNGTGWLCWLVQGAPTCAPWAEPNGDFPDARAEPLRTQSPFGSLNATALRWYGDALCAVGRDGRPRCKAPPRLRGGPEWLDLDAPEQPVARMTDAGWLSPDGVLVGVSGGRSGYTGPVSFFTFETQSPPGGVVDASGNCVIIESGALECSTDVIEAPAGKFRAVTASAVHTCALGVDDDLWCWGDATDGRLGAGAPLCSRTPRSLSAAFHEAWEIDP